MAKVSQYDPSSRCPISRDEFRTSATIFRLFEFQLHQILSHIGPFWVPNQLLYSFRSSVYAPRASDSMSRDQIFHEKSSQSCRSPSLTIGNHVGNLLTHFCGRQSRRDRLKSHFIFENPYFCMIFDQKSAFAQFGDGAELGQTHPPQISQKI